ncbi:post-PEP-CTERM-1 domain-containing protein [Anaeromyxobacter dehalogenans]|uniref:Uncharacterized protein n=1 Tax=Anaeromyxobacter dehalogenans (strain 2CP-C) TaxID=290397 RepID=Q2IEE6_ANADE|nr:hypothetical protein [Anaeromyxobacter dehalogenans]ABC82955.1 hypothetical protein Adeh_3187 [Anaeromyxobacter dehalogenans 2CP-C]
MRPTVPFVMAVAALLGAPGMTRAQHAAKEAPQDPSAAGSAAAQAATDPRTRALRQPTQAELEELLRGLEPLVSQSSDGLTQVASPIGGVGMDLQDRFQSVSLARVGPEGVRTECVGTAAEARSFLEGEAAPAHAPAAAPLEER